LFQGAYSLFGGYDVEVHHPTSSEPYTDDVHHCHAQFLLVRFAPGGPFSSEKKVTEQVLQNLLKKYHMDERGETVPAVSRRRAKGDFGLVPLQRQHGKPLIAQTLPIP
jgi:hypothetical protein